jgi:hypothetical protein
MSVLTPNECDFAALEPALLRPYCRSVTSDDSEVTVRLSLSGPIRLSQVAGLATT